MITRLAAAGGVGVLVVGLGFAGLAQAAGPQLSASGPVAVTGTEASAAFTMGDRVIRQVRYDDRGVLGYTFTLRNDSPFEARIRGLGDVEHPATLFRLKALTPTTEESGEPITLEPGQEVDVRLDVLMTDCERLSARASSLVDTVPVRVESLRVTHTVDVALPEELRTGSAREMYCPRASASTRPPG